jgi:hypothetical protein
MTRPSLHLPARGALLAIAVAAAAAFAGAASAATVTVTAVGPGGGYDLSADGNAAVGLTNQTLAPWRWTAAGGMQNLGRASYPSLHTGGGVPAISADGRVVAMSILDDTGTHVTQGRWTVDGGWQQLAPPLPADGGILDLNDSNVFGMSRDGLVVTGLYWRPGQSGGSAHGSVWTAATNMVGLPTDGGSSRVDDANIDGSVMCGWEESAQFGVRRAAVWVGGVKTMLEPVDDGSPSECGKLNSAGTIAVGQTWDNVSFRTVAARWDWNGAQWVRTLLGVLPGDGKTATAYADGVSDDGSVITGIDRAHSTQFDSKGFIWTAGSGMVDFTRYVNSLGGHWVGNYTVSNVGAVTPDGRVFLVNGYFKRAPGVSYAMRVEVDASAAIRH